MDTEKIITLILAIYGASLSTILGVRELIKERRKVAVFLEHKVWSDTYSIIVTNIGHRPVTLIDISMELPDPYGHVPRGVLRELADPFPITLGDGEHFELKLPERFGGHIDILDKKFTRKIKISIYDAENNEYDDFKILSHNEKFGLHNSK